MEQVSGIGGAFVPAQDPLRLGDWYAQQLGARTIAGTDGLTLFAVAPTANDGPPDGWSLSFQVADLDAMVAQLRAAGATVEIDPAEHPDGRFASLRDPEQNLIQLFEPTGVQVRSAEPMAVRVVDDEPAPDARRTGWRRWAPWLPLLAAVVLALTLVATRQDDTTAEPPGPPAPSRAAPIPLDDPVTVTDVGDRIFGVKAGWELIGQGLDAVVRIQLAEGRITTTEMPELQTTGPTSLLSGPGWVIVHPLDFVPGYFVADGDPAQPLPDTFADGGPMFPGPGPDQVWVNATGSHGRNTLELRVMMTGERAGPRIRIPDAMSGPVTSDGSGHVLVSGPGGSYVARPSGLDKVTTGEVDAVGPEHLLVTECDDAGRCDPVVITRDTGQRRVLPNGIGATAWPHGAIAPDGSIAAVVRDFANGRPLLSIIDLKSGEVSAIGVTARGGFSQSGLVFSPDSRWLFATDTSGALVAIDTGSYRIHRIPSRLPSLTQLTLRPG